MLENTKLAPRQFSTKSASVGREGRAQVVQGFDFGRSGTGDLG
jgi:hypothetical protein